jgi:hypothetical protein
LERQNLQTTNREREREGEGEGERERKRKRERKREREREREREKGRDLGSGSKSFLGQVDQNRSGRNSHEEVLYSHILLNCRRHTTVEC